MRTFVLIWYSKTVDYLLINNKRRAMMRKFNPWFKHILCLTIQIETIKRGKIPCKYFFMCLLKQFYKTFLHEKLVREGRLFFPPFDFVVGLIGNILYPSERLSNSDFEFVIAFLRIATWSSWLVNICSLRENRYQDVWHARVS